MNYSDTRRNQVSRGGSGSQTSPASAEGSNDGAGLMFTGRIASWSARHRWWVLAASALVVVLAVFIMNAVETETLDYNGEGESARAFDLIEDGFEFNSAPTEQLVFSNPSLDADDPAFRSTVQTLVGQLRGLTETESVVSYYDTGDPGMVSDDGHVVLARLVIAGDIDDADEKIDAILTPIRTAGETSSGFEIGMAGGISLQKQVEDIGKEDFGRMIIITMILALTFMLIAFRGVVAAALPLVLAVGSIFTALGVATLVSYVYPMVDGLAEIVLLMGMAVGVDYSLFVVSRYRSERKAGRPKMEAIAVASNTTGRAVFYAGVTVLLSLVGLMFTDSTIFVSFSTGVVIVVLLALVASLTLLPAMRARTHSTTRSRASGLSSCWKKTSPQAWPNPHSWWLKDRM